MAICVPDCGALLVQVVGIRVCVCPSFARSAGRGEEEQRSRVLRHTVALRVLLCRHARNAHARSTDGALPKRFSFNGVERAARARVRRSARMCACLLTRCAFATPD